MKLKISNHFNPFDIDYKHLNLIYLLTRLFGRLFVLRSTLFKIWYSCWYTLYFFRLRELASQTAGERRLFTKGKTFWYKVKDNSLLKLLEFSKIFLWYTHIPTSFYLKFQLNKMMRDLIRSINICIVIEGQSCHLYNICIVTKGP